jgi:hypothetical protein
MLVTAHISIKVVPDDPNDLAELDVLLAERMPEKSALDGENGWVLVELIEPAEI